VRILKETPELEQAFVVGVACEIGSWECPIKDCDIEVFGLDYNRLSTALSRWGKTDLVGRSFGVVKLTLPNGPTSISLSHEEIRKLLRAQGLRN